jgi:hypothetical protein
MKNLINFCCAMMFTLTMGTLLAIGQNPQPASNQAAAPSLPTITETDMLLMRSDLRSEKKKLIALNVPLTETEATKFWPIYDEYVEEMRKVNDEFYRTVRDYSVKHDKWTEAEAGVMLDKWIKLQTEQSALRQRYIPRVKKAITASKAALFFQVDRRLYTLMDLQTSTYLPLVTQ